MVWLAERSGLEEMWTSNEPAKKAADGSHLAIRFSNLQFDEDSDETARSKVLIKGLARIGLDAARGVVLVANDEAK